MRSRAPLALMEQTVVLLVFALAAALCLRAFAMADTISQRSAARDRAVAAAESAAEVIKSCRGDGAEASQKAGGEWRNGIWTTAYDASWRQTGDAPAYTVAVTPEKTAQDKLGGAEVCVLKQDGSTILTLPIAWQEADGGA